MQKLILNIEEGRYEVLLQFLMTLNYVKIEQEAPTQNTQKQQNQPQSQLTLLEGVQQQQTIPNFQEITDPIIWQNNNVMNGRKLLSNPYPNASPPPVK